MHISSFNTVRKIDLLLSAWKTDLHDRDHTEKLGNRFDYMWARVRFGYLALRQGNIREAREVFTETAEVFQKDEVTSVVVFTLEGMAQLFIADSNPKTQRD